MAKTKGSERSNSRFVGGIAAAIIAVGAVGAYLLVGGKDTASPAADPSVVGSSSAATDVDRKPIARSGREPRGDDGRNTRSPDRGNARPPARTGDRTDSSKGKTVKRKSQTREFGRKTVGI